MFSKHITYQLWRMAKILNGNQSVELQRDANGYSHLSGMDPRWFCGNKFLDLKEVTQRVFENTEKLSLFDLRVQHLDRVRNCFFNAGFGICADTLAVLICNIYGSSYHGCVFGNAWAYSRHNCIVNVRLEKRGEYVPIKKVSQVLSLPNDDATLAALIDIVESVVTGIVIPTGEYSCLAQLLWATSEIDGLRGEVKEPTWLRRIVAKNSKHSIVIDFDIPLPLQLWHCVAQRIPSGGYWLDGRSERVIGFRVDQSSGLWYVTENICSRTRLHVEDNYDSIILVA